MYVCAQVRVVAGRLVHVGSWESCFFVSSSSQTDTNLGEQRQHTRRAGRRRCSCKYCMGERWPKRRRVDPRSRRLTLRGTAPGSTQKCCRIVLPPACDLEIWIAGGTERRVRLRSRRRGRGRRRCRLGRCRLGRCLCRLVPALIPALMPLMLLLLLLLDACSVVRRRPTRSITTRLLNPPPGPRNRGAATQRNATQHRPVRPQAAVGLASPLSPRSASSVGVAAMLLQGAWVRWVEGRVQRLNELCERV